MFSAWHEHSIVGVFIVRSWSNLHTLFFSTWLEHQAKAVWSMFHAWYGDWTTASYQCGVLDQCPCFWSDLNFNKTGWVIVLRLIRNRTSAAPSLTWTIKPSQTLIVPNLVWTFTRRAEDGNRSSGRLRHNATLQSNQPPISHECPRDCGTTNGPRRAVLWRSNWPLCGLEEDSQFWWATSMHLSLANFWNTPCRCACLNWAR